MKDLIEQVLFLGGAILIWGKLISISLGIGLIAYACWKTYRLLALPNTVKEYKNAMV